MKSTLKQYFGYATFKPYQKDVIERILEGKDCLVVMATGSGKSLCYQVPPLIARKTGIVISPLISLMQDQVMALKQRGIRGEYLGTTQTDRTVQAKAECGHFDILFMTPEKACMLPVSFWTKLLRTGICLFAVDEAHCISEWGHDFRVEYKQLHKLRAILLDIPFVGLTATATKKVQIDIMNSLEMKDPHVAIGSFDRTNLFYGAKSFNRGLPFLDEFTQEVSRIVASSHSTIIYCTTVKDVEQIYQPLHKEGIKAGIYHGQMDSKARQESHRSFIRDELHVMVATIAFGMGIDKPNIRYVIHYGCPKSLESYYQESGRCGRDGVPSVCLLYFTSSDFAKADFYCGEMQTEKQRKAVVESLMAAQRYCLLTTCRRKFLLEHFGEKFPSDGCGNCDNCNTKRREYDMSREAFLLMACIQSCGGNWGLNMPIDVLRGSRSKRILDAKFDKLLLHGLGKYHSSDWWKSLAGQLISHGYLKEVISDIYRVVSVSTKGVSYLKSAGSDAQPPLILSLTGELVDDNNYGCKSSEGFKTSVISECEGLSEVEGQLYHMLLEERIKLARQLGTAPYAICGDQTLKKLALTRPSTKARLANIDGVNQHLLIRHGDHLLQIIWHLSQQLDLSLDGEASIQAAISKGMYSMPSQQGKLAPAKYETWKMWHEGGLSIPKIANLPSRSAPIKEETVVNYLLDAAQEGFAIDWPRFCDEVKLTREKISNIQDAIMKIGSTGKLKPIKEVLPEDITYPHIKIYLVIQTCGVSPQDIQAKVKHSIGDNELSPASGPLLYSLSPCGMEKPSKIGTTTNNGDSAQLNLSKREDTASFPMEQVYKLPLQNDNDARCSNKRLKVDGQVSIEPNMLEATESSIMDWLQNCDDGVVLSDVLEHFKGSREEDICALLCHLECNFMIFKKNNIYKVF